METIVQEMRRMGLDPSQLGMVLRLASADGNVDTVRELVRRGMSLEEPDDDGDRALHLAAIQGHEEVVDVLLQAGARVDSRNNTGRTPLMWAAAKGNAVCLVYLLGGGAQHALTDNDGDTALHYAAYTGQVACIVALRTAGASTTVHNHAGRTPQDIASAKGFMAAAAALEAPLSTTSSPTLSSTCRPPVAVVGGDNRGYGSPLASAFGGRGYGSMSLHEAAELGDAQLISRRLQAGEAVDAVGSKGRTPLMLAARAGRVAAMEALLSAGASLRSRDDSGGTPLHQAIYGGATAVRTLAARGADVAAVDFEGDPPIQWAAQAGKADSIRALVDLGAKAHGMGSRRRTPLHWAAMEGHVEATQALLDRGATASLDVKDSQGRTPLDHARGKATEAVLQAAARGRGGGWGGGYGGGGDGSSYYTPPGPGTPKELHQACARGDVAVVRRLIQGGVPVNAPDDEGDTPLCWAAMKGQPEVVRVLLELRANPNSRERTKGWMPLHYAAKQGSLDSVRCLLGAGAAPSAAKDDGWTPAHLAAGNGHAAVLRLLLDYGASTASQNEDGSTPLHLAALDGDEQAVRLLLEHHANPGVARSREGATPLHMAARNGHAAVIKMLIDAGASPLARDQDGDTPLHEVVRCFRQEQSAQYIAAAQALLAADASAMAGNNQGISPLRRAAEKGLSQLELVLRNSGQYQGQYQYPLHKAARLGESLAIKMCIDTGGDPQECDPDGNNPLHEVVRGFRQDKSAQYIAAAQVLLAAGASATACNSQGMTPLRAAAQNGLTQLESVLRLGQQRLSPATPNHSPTRPPTPSMHRPPTPDNMEWWEIKFSDLRLVRRMGEGGFGQVYVGEWKRTPVAIKKLIAERDQPTSELLRSLRQEAGLMVNIRNHPNVVSFLGVCFDLPIIVMDLCTGGSLADVLAKAREGRDDMAHRLTWECRINMLLCAARGMLHLHGLNPPMLHRDLKSPNLLVTSDLTVKVTDFNLSKVTDPSRTAGLTNQTMMSVNPRWLVMTFHLPWEQYCSGNWYMQIALALHQGQRPRIPDRYSIPGPHSLRHTAYSEYVALMERCWAQDPTRRPDFHAVITELEEIQRCL